MFHISCLKSGLLRLPNRKSVNNINDYILQMIQLKSDMTDKIDQDTAVTSQPCVKSVGYHSANYNNHTSSISDTQTMWCLSPNTLLSCFSNKNDNLLSHYHVCQDTLSSPDTMSENIFSPNESLEESCDSFTFTKGRYKFGKLQIYCYESNTSPSSGCWTTIPHPLEVDYVASIGQLNISITGSRHKYVSSLFRYL